MAILIQDLGFPPDHLIHHPDIALDDADNLRGDVLIHVVRHWNPMVASGVHGDGGVNGLQEALLVDAGEDETGFIQGLRPFGRSPDADSRERMPDAGKER